MAKKSTLLQVLKKVKDKGVKSLTPVQWETFLSSNTEPNEIDEKIKKLEGYEEKGASYDATGDLIPESNQAMIDRFRARTGRGAGRKSSKVDPNKFLGKEDTSGPTSKPTSGGQGGGAIVKVSDTVEDIKAIVISDQKFSKKKADDDRKEREQKKRGLREKVVEGMGKGVKAIANGAKKMLAPVESIFSKLMGFLVKYLFAGAVMKFVDWMGKGENAKKIQSIFKFLGDWWPAILAGLMAFFPAVLGPVGMIAGTVLLVTVFLPKLINTVKMLFGFGPKVDKEIQKGEKGLSKLEKNEGKDLNLKDEDPNNIKTDTKKQPDELSGVDEKAPNVQQPTETQRMNRGGQVPGSGDKDTVPAMLTPGEFVMSKNAVQEYGVNTLAGMNAAAGGTNRPTMNEGRAGYSGGGPVGMTEDERQNIQALANMQQTQMKQFFGITNTKAGLIGDFETGFRTQTQEELNEENNEKLPLGLKMTPDGQNIDLGKFAGDKARMIGEMGADPKFADALKERGEQFGFKNMTGAQFKAIANEQGDNLQREINQWIPGTDAYEMAQISNSINFSTQQFKPTNRSRISPPPPPSGGSGGGIIPIPIPTGGGDSGGVSSPSGSSIPSFSSTSGGGTAKEHTLGIRR